MRYRSTKTYDHNQGFSCAFRQWRATHSHCSLIHGYALAFKFEFEADELDDRNWVVDFGGLDDLKNTLKYWFDHTTVIAADDPAREHFLQMEKWGLCKLRIIERVGCEAFAQHAFNVASTIISKRYPRVRVVSCEVKEHGANSAIFSASRGSFGDR